MKKQVLLLVCLGVGSPVCAQVTLLGQSRSVRAVWSGGDEFQGAPDFSHFVASVGRIDSGPGQTGAIATQDSTIAPGLFSYTGHVTAFRGGSSAVSAYAVDFRATSPVTFAFDASVAGGSAFGSGSLFALLTGPGGQIINATAFNVGGQDLQIHEVGTLAPGDYSLSVTYSVFGLSTSVEIGGQGTAVMSIVPAPSAAVVLAASSLVACRRRRR